MKKLAFFLLYPDYFDPRHNTAIKYRNKCEHQDHVLSCGGYGLVDQHFYDYNIAKKKWLKGKYFFFF